MRISSTAPIKRSDETTLAEGRASFSIFKSQSATTDFSFTLPAADANYRVSMGRSELLDLVRAATEAVKTAEGRAIAAGAIAALAAILES